MEKFYRVVLAVLFTGLLSYSFAEPPVGDSVLGQEKLKKDIPAATTASVKVKSPVQDKAIADRLQRIMNSTGWYEDINMQVKDGVVFIEGKTKSEEHQIWAKDLAIRLQGVVAVVNQIKTEDTTSWYMEKMWSGLKEQVEKFFQQLPFFGIALIVLLFAYILAKVTIRYTRSSLKIRNFHPLLSDVIARTIGLLCILLGLYIILQILGWTTVALTILGGTGVLGIILGIAFRDITENLLASILLSVQNPFQNEDLIEVDGFTGYVQSLTMRATILMTLDGHEIQIPNAIVYKSPITNFTSNPNRRESFVVGISYEDSISHAQSVALEVLQQHEAVLEDPEPFVLVEELSVSTINLRVFFWIDGQKYNWRKVTSSMIRLVKRAFQEANISMPSQVIELSMEDALRVQFNEKETKKTRDRAVKTKDGESSNAVTSAEGSLESESSDIQEQARALKSIEQEQNLLGSSRK